MEDFFEGLEDEDFAALETELDNAIGAYTTFMESLQDNADLDTAILDLSALFFGDEETDEDYIPYLYWMFGEGCLDACEQV